jgi:Fe-S cluster assembly iron-binding protein IscA
MLTISTSAAEGLRGMLSAVNPSADAGVRLALGDNGGGLDDFELVVSEDPPGSDQTLCQHGVRIHVASDAVAELDDKLLDAQVERGVLRFRLVPR